MVTLNAAQDQPDLEDADPVSAPSGRGRGLLDEWLDHLEGAMGFAVERVSGASQDSPQTTPPRPPGDATCGLGRLIDQYDLNTDECLLAVIALAPLVRPDLFDRVMAGRETYSQNFELLGGMRGKQHRGMLPTGDTALCILAGTDTAARLKWQSYLLGDGLLVREGVLILASPEATDPPMSGRLMLDPDVAELVLSGRHQVPRLSSSFPAQRLTTEQTWDDLVLTAQTLQQVQELLDWVAHQHTLMEGWGMRAKLRPGCRALFYGPPGTGKTLTATLMGAATGRDVLRVDLSAVVSKYIGETEKNLAAIFDKAERKDWILFFDEADSLFGKRSSVKEAKDRYANQEISFLLQRIEVFDGMALLASNLVGNVDVAFSRRFEHIIHFPMPRAGERLKLWQNAIPQMVTLEPGLDLRPIAEVHELSGGSIMNVVRHAALKAIARGSETLRCVDIDQGIRREMAKEGRSR